MMRPRGEARDRAFGGKAGIWLKKTRQNVVVHPNDDERKKVTPPSQSDAVETSKEKTQTNLETIKTATSKRTMVGWDEEKCRPIFMDETTSSSVASTASSTSIDDDEESNGMPESRNNDDEASSEDERSVDVGRNDVPSSLLTTNTENRKTRAYGSRKRKSSNSLLSHAKSNTRQQGPKSKTQAATVMTPSINPMAFDLATPQTAGNKNICAALNSETKATTPVLPVSNTTDENTKPKKKGLLIMKGRKRQKQQQQQAPSSLAQLDFVDDETTMTQPSSSTSLEAARAFFQRLDAQHALNLDSSITTPGAKVVRTRRALELDSNSLLREYQDYASATRATGLEPLSVEQYAVNRSAFFRTGDVYDGFLDG